MTLMSLLWECEFGGLEWWNGTVEWTTGVEYWTGLLECHTHKYTISLICHGYRLKLVRLYRVSNQISATI